MLVYFSIKHDKQLKVWHVLSHIKHNQVSTSSLAEFPYQENDQDQTYQTALKFGHQWAMELSIKHGCFVRDPVLEV
ncbi:MAG: hypothetical protein KGO49_14530 [Gammaproteobacteria bacterium]|nr:hypothetical protein [Gammaproteobacteria bacterium]